MRHPQFTSSLPNVVTFAAALVGFWQSTDVTSQTIYGLQQGVIPYEEGLLLSGYDVLTDTWVDADTLTYAEGFGLGSSTYDQWNDAYVFLGVPSGSMGGVQWMAHPVSPSSEPSFATLSGNLHSLHHDMQSGHFYGLQGYGLDSTWVSWGGTDGYWEISEWGTQCVQVNVVDGEVQTSPVLQMPWLGGVVVGASCFDSDLRRFFVWGIDNAGQGRLTTLDCESGDILWDVAPDLLPNEQLSELEFNIVDGDLVGLRTALDGNGNGSMELVSLNPETGAITPRVGLPQAGSYTPDGTVFDQLQRLYVIHYYVGIGLESRIAAVDATTWEIVADHELPANFLELEMSNVAFASQRYGVSEASPLLAPACPITLSMGQWINQGACEVEVTQWTLDGKRVTTGIVPPLGTWTVPSGTWVWSVATTDQAWGLRTARP